MFEKMKSVYSDDRLRQMQVFALHTEFSEGSETTELYNSQRSGQPPTQSIKIFINTVLTLIIENCSLIC